MIIMKICTLIFTGLIHFSLLAQNDAGRIFVSNDLGENWSRSDNGFPTETKINALALADHIIVAATEDNGIYISSDGLKSWYSSNNGLSKTEKVNALIYHQGLLFAGTYRNGIFVSNDNGHTWKSANNGVIVTSIRCFYSSGNTLLAGTDDGIYRSDDHGHSWIQVSRGDQINSFTSRGPIVLAASNHGILRSENNKDWTTVWNKTAVQTITENDRELIAMSAGQTYLAAGNDGIYWVRIHPFLDRYTFRLTPKSERLFIAPWKKTLKALNKNEFFLGRGLPDNTPFSLLLETPYGIVAAIGFTGC